MEQCKPEESTEHSGELIKRGEQLPLLPSSELPADLFYDSEKRGEFTAERLGAQQPQKYQAVKSLLSEGIGVKTVARIVSVSTHTVQAVRDREAPAIATLKERIAAGARSMSRLCLDTIRDALLDPDAKLSARDMAVVFGILTEKAELLSGQPTSRVNVSGEAGHTELVEYLEGLRQEYSDRMDLEGEKAEEKVVEAEVGEARMGGAEAGVSGEDRPAARPGAQSEHCRNGTAEHSEGPGCAGRQDEEEGGLD